MENHKQKYTFSHTFEAKSGPKHQALIDEYHTVKEIGISFKQFLLWKIFGEGPVIAKKEAE